MITVCLDWNCILALEENRTYAPPLQQIREWYKQGKIALCIAGPSRLENHRSSDRITYNEQEWSEKLRNVGLEGIELRSAGPRFFTHPGLHPQIIEEIHNRVSPVVPFSFQEYAKLNNVELPKRSLFTSFPQGFQQELEQETEEQKELNRKWNNRKNDALSLYAFATWSTPDDVFVTDDKRILNKQELLHEPYRIMTQKPVLEEVHGELIRYLKEVPIEIPGETVFPGHIMHPFEAESYLRERLEG